MSIMWAVRDASGPYVQLEDGDRCSVQCSDHVLAAVQQELGIPSDRLQDDLEEVLDEYDYMGIGDAPVVSAADTNYPCATCGATIPTTREAEMLAPA